MSLEHILLGALEKPQSGYDLKQWFDEVFGFFWSADQSQIYRTMARLEGDGLVSSKQAASALGPAKRNYRTTAKGRAELRRWLLDGPVSAAQRSAIYAQVIFLPHLSGKEAAKFLTTLEVQSLQTVAALEAIAAATDAEAPPTDIEERRRAFFHKASLGLGLARAKATQAFVTQMSARYAAEFTPEGEASDGRGHAA